MNRNFYLLILTLLPALAWAQGASKTAPYVPTELNIILAKDLDPARIQAADGHWRSGRADLDALLDRYQCLKARNLDPAAGRQYWYNLRFADELPIADVEKAFSALPGVTHAGRNFLAMGGGKMGIASTIPTDRYLHRQWGLRNDGGTLFPNAVAGADIKAFEAWDIEKGDTTMKVGIVDSGIRLSHPDLKNRLYRNRAEQRNGIDDDGNGYVDDTLGWNFVADNARPADDQGHGTNIASIIGSQTNNGTGFAGLDWGCKLVVAKVLNSNNSGSYADIAAGINYMRTMGVRVINISIGGQGDDPGMRTACQLALEAGSIPVACMMNFDDDVTYYPAGYNTTVAVGSTDPNDQRTSPFFWSATSGSNYGTHIDISAPGNYIYGHSHTSDTTTRTYWGGTSQATPHVVAAISLLSAHYPQLTPAQLIRVILMSSDDEVGGASEDSAGWDRYHGHGRLNVLRALQLDTNLVTATRQSRSAELIVHPNPSTGAIRLTTPAGGTYALHTSDGRLLTTGTLPAGRTALPYRAMSGLYLLTVTRPDGTRAVERVVVR